MTEVFLCFFEISVSMSVLVAALMFLTPFLSKRYAAKWKFLIWIFVALRLIVPVNGRSLQPMFAGLQHGQAQSSVRPGQAKTPSGETAGVLPSDGARPSARVMIEIPAQMTTEIAVQSKKTGITLLDLAAFVWAAGCLMFLSLHFISYLHCKRWLMRRGHVTENADILQSIAGLKQELHIGRTVTVVVYPEADSPMMIGFLKPLLVLPQESYSREDMFFILKHELVHFKRGDVFYKLLFVAANAIHWFNPLIYVMQKEAGVDMELSCDERVLQGTDYAERKAYTETLLAMVHRRSGGRTVLSTQFYGGKQIMKKRFKNILTKHGKKNGAVALACTIVLSIGLGTLVGCGTAKAGTGGRDSSVKPGEGQDSSLDKTPEGLITRAAFGETVEHDLNGDGKAETISVTLKKDEGYDPMPELTISGKTFDGTYLRDTLSVYTVNAKTDYYYFMDLDTSDSYVEIGFFDNGPSDDPYTWVLRYNGDSLVLLGGFTAAPDGESTVIRGDGTLSALARCDIIQTDYAIGTWKLAGEELKGPELPEGEFWAYRNRYGSEYPVTAKRDFNAFPADPLSSAIVAVPKGTEVAIQSFKKSKDNNNIDIYFYFEDEQGTKHEACIRMEDGDSFKVMLPNETTTSTEVFDGLSFVD